MTKHCLHLSLILVVISLLSCNGKGNDAEYDTEYPSVSEDSVPAIDSLENEEEIIASKAFMPDVSTTELQLKYMEDSENKSQYDSGILPQMAVDAPSYCKKILQSGGKRFIVVDKAKMKLFLYDPYGNVEKSYGIACAKNYGTKHKKGDSRTTEGIFAVKGVFDSTEWLFTDDDGYTSPTKGQYGPRFIRLTIPYIGIHGTGNPSSIGKRCSHGCIRVTNANIMELVKFVEEGMPVIISPGPQDIAVNQSEGYNVLAVATEPGTRKAVAARQETPTHVNEQPDTIVHQEEEPAVEHSSTENEAQAPEEESETQSSTELEPITD